MRERDKPAASSAVAPQERSDAYQEQEWPVLGRTDVRLLADFFSLLDRWDKLQSITKPVANQADAEEIVS